MSAEKNSARGADSAGTDRSQPEANSTTLEPLISSAECARILAISPQTLRVWRWRGDGPDFVRYGGSRGRVLYRPADVLAWIEQQLVRGSS